MIEPKQFKRILVGVDASEQGQNALAYAIHQAQEDGAEKLTIVTVLEEEDLNTFQAFDHEYLNKKREEMKAELDAYAKQAKLAGVENVEVYALEGDTAGQEIVSTAIPNADADLVVVGAHSKEGFFDKIGSQATHIARNTNISVMIVRS